MLYKDLSPSERKEKLDRELQRVEEALTRSQEQLDDVTRRRGEITAAINEAKREVEKYDVRAAEIVTHRNVLSTRLTSITESIAEHTRLEGLVDTPLSPDEDTEVEPFDESFEVL